MPFMVVVAGIIIWTVAVGISFPAWMILWAKITGY